MGQYTPSHWMISVFVRCYVTPGPNSSPHVTAVLTSGVTTAPATPAMQGGGTLGGGAAYYQTYSFLNEKSFDKVAKCTISRPT